MVAGKDLDTERFEGFDGQSRLGVAAISHRTAPPVQGCGQRLGSRPGQGTAGQEEASPEASLWGGGPC